MADDVGADERTRAIRAYWDRQPCGTTSDDLKRLRSGDLAWTRALEARRYAAEPFIHSVAQFTRQRGRELLEIGVGAGTDHLQWARAKARCVGVDLSEASLRLTAARLKSEGLSSRLCCLDGESLCFKDESFDVVYSWGVVHHAARPGRMIAEAHRVLRSGGHFIGMMYGRRSIVALRMWLRHALLRGRPWRGISNVLRHCMESPGTRAYTVLELRELFAAFSDFTASPILTPYDLRYLPRFLAPYLPDKWGWFIALRAVK